MSGNPSLPPKLAALCELNALLAHRPWLINSAHIRALTQGMQGSAAITTASGSAGAGSLSGTLTADGGSITSAGGGGGGGGGGWSLTELTHAITIMCAYHSLCSLVQALGICREPDNGLTMGAMPIRIDLTPVSAQPAAAPTTASNGYAAAADSDVTHSPQQQVLLSPYSPALTSGSGSSSVISGDHLLLHHHHQQSVGAGGPGSPHLNSSSLGSQYAPRTQVAAVERELKSRLLRGAVEPEEVEQWSEIGAPVEAPDEADEGGQEGCGGGEQTGASGEEKEPHDNDSEGSEDDDDENEEEDAVGGGWALSRGNVGDGDTDSFAGASQAGGASSVTGGSGRGRGSRGVHPKDRRRMKGRVAGSYSSSGSAEEELDGSNSGDEDDLSGGFTDEDDEETFLRAGAAPSFDFSDSSLALLPSYLEYGISHYHHPHLTSSSAGTHLTSEGCEDSTTTGSSSVSGSSQLGEQLQGRPLQATTSHALQGMESVTDLLALAQAPADFRHLLGSGTISNVSLPAFNTKYRERKRMHNERRNARRRSAKGGAEDDYDGPAVSHRLRRPDSSAVVVGNTHPIVVLPPPQVAAAAAGGSGGNSTRASSPLVDGTSDVDGPEETSMSVRPTVVSSAAAIIAAVDALNISPSSSSLSVARDKGVGGANGSAAANRNSVGFSVGLARALSEAAVVTGNVDRPPASAAASGHTDFDHQQHLRSSASSSLPSESSYNTSTRARSLINASGCDPFATPASDGGASAGHLRPTSAGGNGASSALAAEFDISRFRYRDFDTAEGMLITHDFSWEDHAYALLQRFYPAAAPVLDKEFRLAFSLTYGTLGTEAENVNTEPFRTAVWVRAPPNPPNDCESADCWFCLPVAHIRSSGDANLPQTCVPQCLPSILFIHAVLHPAAVRREERPLRLRVREPVHDHRHQGLLQEGGLRARAHRRG